MNRIQFDGLLVGLIVAWAVVYGPGAARAQDVQDAWVGHWAGQMEREGKPADLALDLVRSDSALQARFTSLRQRVMEYPLDAVTTDGDVIRLELGGGALVFEGERSADSLEGTFVEGEGEGTFELRRTPPPDHPYEVTDVRFRSGDVTLAGTKIVPDGEGPFPAVVFVHGAGPEIRWGAARYFADRLGRRGIASLIYDKRGTGESTGDWRAADFEQLAGDVLGATAVLREDRRIDPSAIGIHGHSQGGSMAPLIAVRAAGAIAFIIAGAATGVPMWESEIHSLRSQVRDLGIEGEALARADVFAEQMVAVARAGGEGWDDLAAEAQKARERGEPWIDLLDPPPRDFYFWSWWPSIAEYDSAEWWARVDVPVLVIEAENDTYVPVEASVPRIDAALRRAGNDDYTILVLPMAPHNFLLRPGPGEPFDWPRLAPGYTDLVAAWILYRSRSR
ncbi:MAG TPA: alpha/beta fold hydrolase [Gemmatimonadota bacterium]